MKTAVIYPRYSSVGQNEQTIETQIQICKEYAEKQGLIVLKVFDGDKAKSASKETEKRKDLHRMLAAAESGTFRYIIVYELNRFMRNRAESVLFKSQLEKYGVKILSACENINDDEGGELYEMILEWRDEKYSRDLLRRVIHGLDTSVAKGTFGGGNLIYGYKKHKEPIYNKNDKFVVTVMVDDEQASIVKFVFDEYDKGTEKREIAEMLTAKGYRYNGKLFKGRTFDKWMTNEKYTGKFYFGNRQCNNMYPQIIDKAQFDRVQKRLKQNQYFAGANSTKEPYLLQSKVFCGHCETGMVSDGGTGRFGKKHYYYACRQKKKGKCDKKRENKEHLELYVVERVIEFLSNPKNVSVIADDIIKYYEQRTGNESLRSVETRIVHINKKASELTTAFIEAKSNLLRANIEKRMAENETLLNDLAKQLAQLQFEQGLKISKADILLFVSELLQGNKDDKKYQKKLIDNLVAFVYVYDDTVVIYLNIKGGGSIERPNTADTNNAITDVSGVQTLSPLARQVRSNLNSRFKLGRFCFICTFYNFGVVYIFADFFSSSL
ncbi:MAG: recombinase family protein [Firmicutes bacterium]|nr:recombinase family protein [Bacillota bacterium]